jgi:hypothetical protein
MASVTGQDLRHVSWFHELDAWTEYWDVYHPESEGRYYFGNSENEAGLLSRFLPRVSIPPPFQYWKKMALGQASESVFLETISVPDVAAAICEVDELLDRLFSKHFGDAADAEISRDYIEAMFRFALDTLPAATERDSRIPADDPRKATAGRHTLDGDIMWFAWALHTEAAEFLRGNAGQHRRQLMLGAIAAACPVNFIWRGHRRSRPEYQADEATLVYLKQMAGVWRRDFQAARTEVHCLFKLREWGVT